MKESEWLTFTVPTVAVFRSLFARVAKAERDNPLYPEKMRRFALACARRMGAALTADDLRALDLLDNYCRTRSAQALKGARAAYSANPGPQPWGHGDEHDPVAVMLWWARSNARQVLESCLKPKPAHTVRAHLPAASGVEALRLISAGEVPAEPRASTPDPSGTELAVQADLLRDIFGNPFRPVTFSPSWRTDTAVTLARQM